MSGILWKCAYTMVCTDIVEVGPIINALFWVASALINMFYMDVCTLSKLGPQRLRRDAKKDWSISSWYLSFTKHNLFVWLPYMFLFPLKFRWIQRLLLNETMYVSSWNVGHILKTACKWSSWSLTPQMSALLCPIFTCFLSSVISLIVSPTLPSPSSAVCLRSLIL